jgi:hypothetical protein
MLGPISTSNLFTNDTPVPELPCNPQSGSIPYIPLTITINGVDYMVDSQDNLIYNSSDDSTPGQARCDIPLVNTTSLDPPEIGLGMPFLRSVYLYVLSLFLFSFTSHLHRPPSPQCISLPHGFVSRVLRLRIPKRSQPYASPNISNTHGDAYPQLTVPRPRQADLDPDASACDGSAER